MLADKIRKHFYTIFKSHGLSIEVECNIKSVNYLDITLNLDNETYTPFHKPNDETLYIHAKSNHPPNIIKQLPLSIEKRLSNLSANKNIFDKSTRHYQDALNKCEYSYNLKYDPDNTVYSKNVNSNSRNRKRNIIWFNPPFSKNVSTNIGKFFFNLLTKHFPKKHKYYKLFNKIM